MFFYLRVLLEQSLARNITLQRQISDSFLEGVTKDEAFLQCSKRTFTLETPHL